MSNKRPRFIRSQLESTRNCGMIRLAASGIKVAASGSRGQSYIGLRETGGPPHFSRAVPMTAKAANARPSQNLEWRFPSALFLACDACLLQIELALDASACLVGNLALSQQLIDVFAFGGNQFCPEVRGRGSSFEPI